MRHHPQIENLKTDTSVWKRIVHFSKSEWTPKKVSVVALLLTVLALFGYLLAPERSIRDFKANSTDTAGFEFSDIKLQAFDGLRVTIGADFNSRYTSLSQDKGALITGRIKNTTPNLVFIRAGVATTSANSSDASEHKSTYLDMEIPKAELVRNWNKVRGYIVNSGESYVFHLVSVELDIENSESFDLAFEWKYVDLESTEQFSDISAFTFSQAGKSFAWGGSKVYWKTPPVFFDPDLGVPKQLAEK